MEIRAYDENYIYAAQNILGHAVDFAVTSLNIDIDEFGSAFAVSNVSKQFANGNPKYVIGMNGCEFAREILRETKKEYNDVEDVMYLDKSPEYWAGWALAFYQWYVNKSFMSILSVCALSDIVGMYGVYHEMDIMHFVENMDRLMNEKNPDTQLKVRRINCGMSQSELASESGVALRQIQLFEQRQRNINNAAASTLLRLSKALHCKMEDLME